MGFVDIKVAKTAKRLLVFRNGGIEVVGRENFHERVGLFGLKMKLIVEQEAAISLLPPLSPLFWMVQFLLLE